MKTVKTFAALTFGIVILFGTSCVVVEKHDNGKHKGWYKNSNNPHHPNSTNPGKGNKN